VRALALGGLLAWLLVVGGLAQQTVGVAADHDGVCTTTYVLLDGSQTKGTLPISALSGGVITFTGIALAAGVHNLKITASGPGILFPADTAVGTGTLVVSTGDALVTGIGTKFTTELVQGGAIWIHLVELTVQNIASDIALTLEEAYVGTPETGLAFRRPAPGTPATCMTDGVTRSATSAPLAVTIAPASLPPATPTNVRVIGGGGLP
jgi:hypothetical protein